MSTPQAPFTKVTLPFSRGVNALRKGPFPSRPVYTATLDRKRNKDYSPPLPSINAFTELVRSNIAAEFKVKDEGTIKELPMDTVVGLTLPSRET